MEERDNLLKFPWIPDMVTYTLYKFDLCYLCKVEKEKNGSFDNAGCIHCRNKTKMISGCYKPTGKNCHLDIPLTD